jgi:hypothetical protein
MILVKTGGDMSRFPSAAHLAAWAGVAPGVHESARQRTPVAARPGTKRLTAMLVEAAGSVRRMKGADYLAAQHTQLTTPPRQSPGPGRRDPLHPGSLPTACCGAMRPTGTSAPTG